MPFCSLIQVDPNDWLSILALSISSIPSPRYPFPHRQIPVSSIPTDCSAWPSEHPNLILGHLSPPLQISFRLLHLSQYDVTSHCSSQPRSYRQVQPKSINFEASTQNPVRCHLMDKSLAARPARSTWILPMVRLLQDTPLRLACKSRT